VWDAKTDLHARGGRRFAHLLLATRMLCCTQDQRFAPAIASRPNLLSCLHRPRLKVPLADVAMSGSRSSYGPSLPYRERSGIGNLGRRSMTFLALVANAGSTLTSELAEGCSDQEMGNPG
jgi:hypothetical protein